MKKSYISKKEFNKLQKELLFLSKVKRKTLSNDLELAIGEGDMRECAAYYVAMDLMIENDRRINGIQKILKHSQYTKPDSKSIKVGSRLLISIKDTKKTIEIVSSFAVDPFNNKISLESKIGKIITILQEGESKHGVKLIRIL